jgi:hypothetical protein
MMKEIMEISSHDCSCCHDYEDDEDRFECSCWEDFQKEILDEELKKTRIKYGFLEIHNGTWQKLHGTTPIFEISAQSVIDKMGDFEWTLYVRKEGHQLSFTRTSHDEMGATILLKPASKYEGVEAEIYGS